MKELETLAPIGTILGFEGKCEEDGLRLAGPRSDGLKLGEIQPEGEEVWVERRVLRPTAPLTTKTASSHCGKVLLKLLALAVVASVAVIGIIAVSSNRDPARDVPEMLLREIAILTGEQATAPPASVQTPSQQSRPVEKALPELVEIRRAIVPGGRADFQGNAQAAEMARNGR